MKKNNKGLFLLIFTLGFTYTANAAREVRDFNADWKFTLGDPAGAEAPAFNDFSWRALAVPHDWAFEADYSPEGAQTDKGGYKPGGLGWYRKTFDIPKEWKNKRVSIDFDAVYMNSEVWINGKHLGKYPYGYNSFSYDITKHIKPEKNIIAVRVDSSLEPSARWYHGCGIYANVKLIAKDPIHIAKDGVFITTPKITDKNAEVSVEIEINNTKNETVEATVETVLLDPSEKKVASNSQKISLAPNKTSKLKQSLTVPSPQRWDIDTPNLYKAVSRVLVNDTATDTLATRFGIRTIRWDKLTGFWLNGRVVKMKGVADHSEAGPVGAAYPDELLRWKIQQLKDMGCNAIRTAHNPQTPVFYDMCDEMGILVMDEIFDGWKTKAPKDYGNQAFAEWWERDLRAWLKRDRNHPSVVVWSMGNETRGPVAPDLVKVCHEMDPTRLVTSGHSGSEHMDIEGVNGNSETLHMIEQLAKHRNKPFVSTEAPHTWQVRGYYRSVTWWRDGPTKKGAYPCPDLTKTEVFMYDWIKPANRENRKMVFNSSYDNAMVRITARKNWELMRDLPWHSGHFRWTGIDYLGEAGYVHGGWPFRAFMGGPLDLALFRKDLFYFYQSQWTTEPMVHILPHWTHPRMKTGTKIPVWVYSNCDEVELFFNGKSLGKDKPGKKWNEMQCDWMVPWARGKLEAVGYKGGKEVARTSQTTADAPAKLKLSTKGNTCPVITVTQTDDKGIMNPYAENRIHYYIDGPARIMSLESGNPVNTENNFGKTSRTAFFGLARAFLKTTADAGDISLVVGAICGEKQVMTSDIISIDVKPLTLRGAAKNYDLKILYSTDGSKPSIDYTKPFKIKPSTTVKADVYNGNKLLFSMNERFGPNEGIYWLTEDEAAKITDVGDQAEKAVFEGAKFSRNGEGFNGSGYIVFKRNAKGFVEWYQENDGEAEEQTLTIRYNCKNPKDKGYHMKLTVNDKVVHEKLLFPNAKALITDWKTISAKINIDRGANKIRLIPGGTGVINIDEIRIK